MQSILLGLDTRINNYASIDLMQGYNYTLEAHITDNYKDMDLTGVTVQLQMQKPDKKFIIQTENIIIEGNKIKAILDKDFTREDGQAKLQVVLFKDNFTFGSWVVKAKIKPSAINDNDGQSENKVTITEGLINKINEAENTKIELDKSIANGDVATIKGNVDKIKDVEIPKINEQLETNAKLIDTINSKKADKIYVDTIKGNVDKIKDVEIPKINSQLDTITHEVERPISLNKCDSEMLGAIQNKEGETTFNLLSIPRDKSVTPEKTTFFQDAINIYNPNDESVKDNYYYKYSTGYVGSAGYTCFTISGLKVGDVIRSNYNFRFISTFGATIKNETIENVNEYTLGEVGTDTIIVTFGIANKNSIMIVKNRELPNIYTPYKEKLKEEIVSVPNKSITTDKLDLDNIKFGIDNVSEFIKSENLLNLDSCIDGQLLQTGNLVANSNYTTSDFIEVLPNTVYSLNNLFNRVWYYDSYGSYSNSYSEVNAIKFTTGITTKYIRFSFPTYLKDKTQLCKGEVLPPYLPYNYKAIPNKYVEGLEFLNKINFEDTWVRKDVFIKLSDTQEDIFLKLVESIKIKNCNVYFETGEYVFDTIFELMKTKYGYTTAYELPVGGNCKYYFNSSTLIGNSVSNDNEVLGNQSLIGSRRTSGNYELHDGVLIANDMIYVVHDEAQGSSEYYIRKYKNMRMIYNTITSTQLLRKCIGGGSGLKGTVIIEKCYFESDYGAEVSYHGYQSSNPVNFNLTISNSYFKNRLRLNSMYDNGKGFSLINGCSFGQNIENGMNWTLCEFNNTIRL